jgi:hypothetical protein
MFDHSSRKRISATSLRLCFMMLLALSAPATLSTARADTTSSHRATIVLASQAPFAWTWSRLLRPMERLLADQKSMIRFGVVALFAAMYIIWWRK